MRDVKVSLVGYGIVGHGVVDVLNRKKKMLYDMGLNLKLISVTDHTGTVLAEEGVDADKILKEKTLASVATHSMKGKEAIEAIPSDLVIEVTPTNIVHGQPGLGDMEAALSSGKHVVTSNKGPLVVAYSRLKRMAEEAEVMLSSRPLWAAPCPSSAWWRERWSATPSSASGAYSTAPATISNPHGRGGNSLYPCPIRGSGPGHSRGRSKLRCGGCGHRRKVVILANSVFNMNVKYSDVDAEQASPG